MSLIVVSNREPYQPVRSEGGVEWKASVGGLTAALTPVLERQGGTWIAKGIPARLEAMRERLRACDLNCWTENFPRSLVEERGEAAHEPLAV